jgi:glycosyltransferase involved in cell wall biosynthesis
MNQNNNYITNSALPMVSVIIPTYNRAHMVSRAIKSVLAQTYQNFECIIIDNASTDGTLQILSAWAKSDCRVKIIKHATNRFACASRNSGIMNASGKLIAFLDDDDEWLPTKLERQVELIENSPAHIGLVYCWMNCYEPDGHLISKYRPALRGDVFRKVLANNVIGGTPTLLIRRSVIELAGLWDESLRAEDDDEWIARLCRHTYVDFVPDVLVRVNTGHGSQISRPKEWSTAVVRSIICSMEKRLALSLDIGHGGEKPRAILYARLANFYFRIGERGKSLQYFSHAFSVKPMELEIYHMILSLAKWYIIPSRNL